MCKYCRIVKDGKKLFEREQYVILEWEGEIYAILKKHSEKANGCDSCIKGYMYKSLCAIAFREWKHSRFHEHYNEKDHYCVYTKKWATVRY